MQELGAIACRNHGRSGTGIMGDRVQVQSGARRQLIDSFTRWLTDAVHLPTTGDRVQELWAIACRCSPGHGVS